MANLLGQMAGTIRRVENFIVEHGEVEGQTKANRVRWRQLEEGNVLHTHDRPNEAKAGTVTCKMRILSGLPGAIF